MDAVAICCVVVIEALGFPPSLALRDVLEVDAVAICCVVVVEALGLPPSLALRDVLEQVA